MRFWKFSQKTKVKQKFFADSEKEVGNFFKTGTIVPNMKVPPSPRAWFSPSIRLWSECWALPLILKHFLKSYF